MNLIKWPYHFTAMQNQILEDLDNLTIIVGIFVFILKSYFVVYYNVTIKLSQVLLVSIVTTKSRAFS